MTFVKFASARWPSDPLQLNAFSVHLRAASYERSNGSDDIGP